MKRIGFCCSILLCALLVAVPSQGRVAGTPQKTSVQKAPIKHTSAASGREMYMPYCAACHGENGKGDGPAASTFKEPPPDLTALAQNNNGTFPSDHVAAVLRFEVETPAHGSKEMPVWGNLFGALQHTERTDALVDTNRCKQSNLTISCQTRFGTPHPSPVRTSRAG